MKKYTFTFSILTLFAALTLLLSVFLMGNFFIRGMKQAYRITENKISEANRTISNTLTETISQHQQVFPFCCISTPTTV
ncbi:hypothetical protein [Seleniivibrio woodruffii]|uniref:Uncharacterized protein n=1 Tax=Seleniivibrio woodruffii TaxID=1078050 RepID=A0A4V2PSA2_9BACT|nr:hypothetical protein [Seleniivibrio woodruffii]TCK61911.1 hypothetical protein C8D98_0418 [Seleniivibrio woodruffii]TVZ34972.1 hypothetical protein OF66_0574 [Seleniivibrio woodruffii]